MRGNSSILSEEAIDRECQATGNTIGWRFLYSPSSVLDGAEIAIIGPHPGGEVDVVEHPRFSTDNGSAYVTESWFDALPSASQLQKQVKSLCLPLGVDPAKTLSGNLVPFRAKTFSDIKKKNAAVAFGSNLWLAAIQRSKPELVIALGREAEKALASVLSAKLDLSIPVGWGELCGRKYSIATGRLVALPHFSRYPIVDRQESQEAMKTLFASRWRP